MLPIRQRLRSNEVDLVEIAFGGLLPQLGTVRTMRSFHAAVAGLRINDAQMRGIATELVHNEVLTCLDASGVTFPPHTHPAEG